MPEYKQSLIALLAEHAYQEGEIVLSSGKTSNVYLDAKQVTYHCDGVEPVGYAILEIIGMYDVAAVGGLTMGADAIVSSTVWAAKLLGVPLSGFVGRKEPKKHGLHKLLEGVVPPPGSRVAIVDDVVTSGGSILQAVEAARRSRLEVAVVVPLVDREEGGEEAVRKEGIPFRPICTLTEIREASHPRLRAIAG